MPLGRLRLSARCGFQKNMCNLQDMIEITLPPRIAALCGSCETNCVSGCCGISAFSFSPFNIIYHLTRFGDGIGNQYVAEIRSEMAELVRKLGGSDRQAGEVSIEDFNEYFTVEQLISLFDLIDAALSEACAIYAMHEKQVEQGHQKFLRIIETPNQMPLAQTSSNAAASTEGRGGG